MSTESRGMGCRKRFNAVPPFMVNNCTSTMLIGIKRESVKRVLKAIVTRYGIDLTD
ncbi:hypothetical protein [Paraburkholderia sp. HD33-4]|uniref:hypothetical protein n=1 Tax=Paraburkholderia sp. HD33-4 TaxID=2883242 RepID=UPI001F2FD5C0|nr:hypothetical protein [Paraburkholderia sp. HD33-4]